MKVDAMLKRIAPLIPAGESVLAATKAMPRGSAQALIFGIAGAVGGGTAGPGLAGVGAVAGIEAGSRAGDTDSGADEAGVDVGSASQVLLVATDRSVLLFALSAMGRPKELTAQLDRAVISSVVKGETKLFGQKMMEIVLTTETGAEVGFGIAKVHRRQGEAILSALS